LSNKDYFLIEKKHSDNSLVPSIADIKDGLVKMMLYTNFSEVLVSGASISHHSTLGLTSKNIGGYCHTYSSKNELKSFFSSNQFTKKSIQALIDLFDEGRNNNILIFLMSSRNPSLQNEIAREFIKRKKQDSS